MILFYRLKVVMSLLLVVLYQLTARGSCPEPFDLNAINISTSGFTVTWSDSGTLGSVFLVEGDPSGFIPGTGTVIPTTDTFLVLNISFPAGQQIDFYVSQVCLNGDTSNQVGPFTFVIPIENDFCTDAIELTVQQNGCASPVIGTNDGASDSGSSPTPVCAGYNGGDVWYKSVVPANGSIIVEVSNAGGFTDGGMEVYLGSCGALTFLECNDDGGLGLQPMISQSGLSPGDTLWIRVWEFGNNAFGDFGICAYSFSCSDPTGLNTRKITTDTVELFWTGGSGSTWQVEYGPSGFTSGNGTLIPGINDTFYVLAGLTAATPYDFYVREICGPADTSSFSGPSAFTTACLPFIAPYLQTFDNGGVIPACWTTFGNELWLFGDGTGAEPTHGGNAGNISDNTSGSGFFAWVDDSAPHSTGTTLESPYVDVSVLPAPELSFWLNSDNEGTSNVNFSLDFWDGAAWNTGIFTSNANTNGWQEFVVDISILTITGPVKVRFIVDENNGTNFYDDIALDDVHFRTSFSCQDPANLTVNLITGDSVTIDWTSANVGAYYILEYGIAGFTPGTGSVVTGIVGGVSPQSTLGNLSPNSNYGFYVREVCAPGDTTITLGPITVGTLCATITAPYLENFETLNAGAFGVLSNCWEGKQLVNPRWLTEVSNGANKNSLSTGPIWDQTLFGTSGGIYMFMETSAGTLGSSAELESPFVDLAGLSDPYFSFYYHMYGATMGELHVDVWDGATWNNDLIVIVGEQQTAGADPWLEIGASLATYAGQTIKIRFRGLRGSSFTSDMSLDDVRFGEAPTCPNPINLSVNLVTGDSVNLDWTTANVGAGFIVEFGPAGFSIGTGNVVTGIVSGSSPAASVGGLASNTDYSFYITEICGPGDTSTTLGPVLERTPCATFTAPYFEDFETLNDGDFGVLNNCWEGKQLVDPKWLTEVSNGANKNSLNTGPFWDNTLFGTSGGFYMFMESSAGTLGASAELESPFVDLSGLTDPYFSFYYHMYGATMGELHVDVWDGTSWNDDLILIIGEQQTAGSAPWLEIGTSLMAYTGQTIKVRFRGLKGSSFTSDMSIDDVRIDEAPTCPNPINLSGNPISADSAHLDWASSNLGASYRVEYGPAGFTPGTGTIITGTVGGSSPIATITGLSPVTDYSFYVLEICGPGDSSAVVGPSFFKTPCATFVAPYFEDFETLNDGDFGELNNCWEGKQLVDPKWLAEVSSGSNKNSLNTGPFWDHTLFGIPGGFYMFMETSSGTLGASAELESPLVDLSGLAEPYFSFYYHMYGATMGDLHVDVWDGTTWINDLIVIIGQQQTSGDEAWRWAGVSLSAYSGQVIKIRFRGLRGSSFTSDMSIDDVRFDEAPPQPVNDSCHNAIALSCNSVISGSTLGATKELGVDGTTCGTSITSAGVWYTVQGTGGTLLASTCNNANFDTKISVFQGDCNSLVCVGGNNDSGNCSLGSSEFSWNSLADTTYYVLVHGNQIGVGNFDLTVNTLFMDITGLSSSYCITDPVDTLSGTPAGGTFGGPGMAGNVFHPIVAQPGSHLIYYAYQDTSRGCLDTFFQVVTVVPQTNVSFTGLASGYCSSDNSPAAISGIPPGGTFSGPGVSGNSFIPSAAGPGTHSLIYELLPSEPYFVDTTCTFAPISGSPTSVVLGDDVLSPPLPIGFTFEFFGLPYTQFQISSNGFITFDLSNTNSGLANSFIPDPFGINNFIALVWDDLVSPTVNYYNVGTAPNRKLVVHFHNSFHFNITSEVVNGQIILSEGSNEIEIQCIACSEDVSDPTATQGIENSNGTIGYSVPGRNNGNWSAYSDCARFVPTTCLGRDTQQVVVSVPPLVNAGQDVTICEGTGIGLSASGTVSYVWSTTDSAQSIFVTPVSDSIFSVTGIDSAGCTGVDDVLVVVLPTPAVNLADTSFCSGGSVTLDAGNPGSVYKWSTGETTQVLNVVQTGVYTVTVIDTSNSCQAVESSVVTVQPELTLTLADKGICPGDSAVLDAGYPGSIYNWSTMESTQTIVVSNAGMYSVTVDVVGGCTASDTLTVSFNPLPSVSFSGFSTMQCFDIPVLLTGGSPQGGVYTGTGISGNTFVPQLAGLGDHILTYTYTDFNGCTSSTDLLVTVDICDGVENIEVLSDVNVYPNPFYDKIWVELHSTRHGTLTVRMLDLLGKSVMEQENNIYLGKNQLVLLPDARFLQGIYFVELRIAGELHLFKVIRLK